MALAQNLKSQPHRSRKLKIGLYVRTATKNQLSILDNSVRHQTRRLCNAINAANKEGLFGEVTHVFVDRGRSGRNPSRPGLERLLKAVRAAEIDLVLVTDPSRLSRSIADCLKLLETMKTHGCPVKYLDKCDTFTLV
jgi:site-specific DNA recombinase